jgi:hypothetical protein
VRHLSYSRSLYGTLQRVPAQPEEGPSPSTDAPTRRRRIPTVDIVRGVLMTLIICTHALANVDPVSGGVGLTGVRLFLSGTVGFATLSGMLVGYFLVAKADDLKRVFRGYAMRALVLTLVAHPLISLALNGPIGGGASFLDFMARSIYITDVLAVIFVTIVPLTPRFSPRARLGAGIALIFAARLLILIPAQGGAWLLVRELLAGIETPGPTVLLSTYPLLTIAGMFLVGSWLGHRFGIAQRTGTLPQLSRRFLVSSAGLVVASLVMLALWAVCRWHIGGIDAPSLKKVFYPQYSLTSYPAYLAGVVFLMGLLITRKSVGPLEGFFLVFGRTSLFTYVIQYYVVQTLPWLLHWKHRMHTWQAALYLAISLPLMNATAAVYDRLKRHGFRTVASATPQSGAL